MKAVLIASIGLAALSMLAPGANAQQPSTTTVTLVQKFQPVVRSYPGVSADILGIRTGMTVSQAEAIAEKSYPGKPWVYTGRDTYRYRGIEVQSHPYVKQVTFLKRTAQGSDVLSLHFSSPVTGNSLYAIARIISFLGGGSSNALDAPLVSALNSSLIKKYGPPIEPGRSVSTLFLGWAFTQTSPITCAYRDCVSLLPGASNDVQSGGNDGMGYFGSKPYVSETAPNDWTDLSALGISALKGQCAPYTDRLGPRVLMIWARIDMNDVDPTKAKDMDVAIGDSETCINDSLGLVKQLKADAIKYYNSVSKPSTAPKL